MYFMFAVPPPAFGGRMVGDTAEQVNATAIDGRLPRCTS
jgi:hypothetical protein